MMRCPKLTSFARKNPEPVRIISCEFVPFYRGRIKFHAMSDTLVVNEIYLSLQGESTFAGLPCVFIRLTACDLRCSYCDTAYAFTEGKKMPLAEILAHVRELAKPFSNSKFKTSHFKLPLVELTGGEPLLQKNSLPLMKSLCDDGFTVLIETSGAHDISPVDPRVRRIMDLKCPSSGEVGTQSFRKPHAFEGHRRNQVRHRHAWRITNGRNSKSPRTSWLRFARCCFPGCIRSRRNSKTSR